MTLASESSSVDGPADTSDQTENHDLSVGQAPRPAGGNMLREFSQDATAPRNGPILSTRAKRCLIRIHCCLVIIIAVGLLTLCLLSMATTRYKGKSIWFLFNHITTCLSFNASGVALVVFVISKDRHRRYQDRLPRDLTGSPTETDHGVDLTDTFDTEPPLFTRDSILGYWRTYETMMLQSWRVARIRWGKLLFGILTCLFMTGAWIIHWQEEGYLHLDKEPDSQITISILVINVWMWASWMLVYATDWANEVDTLVKPGRDYRYNRRRTMLKLNIVNAHLGGKHHVAEPMSTYELSKLLHTLKRTWETQWIIIVGVLTINIVDILVYIQGIRWGAFESMSLSGGLFGMTWNIMQVGAHMLYGPN